MKNSKTFELLATSGGDVWTTQATHGVRELLALGWRPSAISICLRIESKKPEMSRTPDRSSQSSYPLLRKWTAEEHEELKRLAAAGTRPDEIAKLLKRTEAAVRVRAWQHGIALGVVPERRGKQADEP